MMKSYIQVVLLLVLGTFAVARVTPRNKFETGLLNLIHKCRDGDVDSLPIEFPSLKPLKLPPVRFDYWGYSISISELKIKGLENMTVQKLSSSLSDLSVTIEITVPALAIRADRYHLKAKALGLISIIDDKGIFRSNINNLVVRADIQFGADGADTVIRNINLDYSADNIQVQLSGTSEFLNEMINNKISDLLTDTEMKEKVQDLIVDMASGYLEGHTPREFIEIISDIEI